MAIHGFFFVVVVVAAVAAGGSLQHVPETVSVAPSVVVEMEMAPANTVNEDKQQESQLLKKKKGKKKLADNKIHVQNERTFLNWFSACMFLFFLGFTLMIANDKHTLPLGICICVYAI